jgi:hypothetical protein
MAKVVDQMIDQFLEPTSDIKEGNNDHPPPIKSTGSDVVMATPPKKRTRHVRRRDAQAKTNDGLDIAFVAVAGFASQVSGRWVRDWAMEMGEVIAKGTKRQWSSEPKTRSVRR